MDQMIGAPCAPTGIVVTVKTSPGMACVRRVQVYETMAQWCLDVGIVETDFAEILRSDARFYPTLAVRFARADDARAFQICWRHALASN